MALKMKNQNGSSLCCVSFALSFLKHLLFQILSLFSFLPISFALIHDFFCQPLANVVPKTNGHTILWHILLFNMFQYIFSQCLLITVCSYYKQTVENEGKNEDIERVQTNTNTHVK